MNAPRTTTPGRAGATRTRLAALLLALLLALALGACGGEREATSATATAEHATADHAATEHAAEHAAPEDATAAHAAHEAPADEHAAEHAADAHSAHEQAPEAAATDDHAAHDHHEHAETLAAAALPGTSIFHLTSEFTDQHRRGLALGELRGAPSVFVMFYGDCTTACPLLVRAAEEIQAGLPEDLQESTRFVMVSFDTERDTPERLLAYAQEKDLDRANWRWLVGSPLQTRQLATLLGVQYRDAGNGVFAHSNLITVLDADGVPSARIEGLGVKLDPAIAAIRAAGPAAR